MPLLWSGKVAMINYWHGAVGEIRAYNDSIDKGAVKGTKADFPLILLPWPYDAENGANVNIARTTGLAVFKQNPYKGDAHMANVVDFLRYLTSPVNLATFANWEGDHPCEELGLPVCDTAEGATDRLVGLLGQGARGLRVPVRPSGLRTHLERRHQSGLHGSPQRREDCPAGRGRVDGGRRPDHRQMGGG